MAPNTSDGNGKTMTQVHIFKHNTDTRTHRDMRWCLFCLLGTIEIMLCQNSHRKTRQNEKGKKSNNCGTHFHHQAIQEDVTSYSRHLVAMFHSLTVCLPLSRSLCVFYVSLFYMVLLVMCSHQFFCFLFCVLPL